jgi:hypothetical protein
MKKTSLIFPILLFLFSMLNIHSQIRIWNINSLCIAKNSSSAATLYLIRNANKELNESIQTVMDKKMTPPSGDKHEYISMGRYWWPNPETADGLPYIRKDGVVNSEIDNLDREPLSHMTRSVITLSLAYYLTSDDKYAAKAVENLRIWFINKDTRMNPNMNFGQFIPGHNNNKGRGEGVLDTYSFIQMLDGVELLKQSPKFSKQDQQALKDWFETYLNWMLTSKVGEEESDAKNNHGTAFDVQVIRYALFVGKEDLAKKYIDAFPEKRMFQQIKPNGAQPLELARTTAFGYSVFNITHILDACMMAKTMGIDLFGATSKDGRSITKAIDFLTPYLEKAKSDFPYKQIKLWDAVQQNLCWQLYRVDYSFLNNHSYEKKYGKFFQFDPKDINYIIY